MRPRVCELRWVLCRLTAALLVLLGGACSGGGGPSTTGLTDQQEVELEARAISRAWRSPRLCVDKDYTSVELGAALAELYMEVVYVEVVNLEPDVGWDRCTLVSSFPARWLGAEVVGVDVYIVEGPLILIGRTYLFRWNGSAWVDTTPEETGITVTTAIA